MLRSRAFALLLILAAAPASAQSLSGIGLDDALASTASIGMKPTASNEMGPHSLRRWVFPDGNELAVTARRSDGRIVYLESTWGGRVPGSPTDYPGVKFGETTLNELRATMGSNGFTYASRAMFEAGDGIATANSYEIAGRPAAVVTFVSLVKGSETDLIRSGRRKLGDVAKVDSVILGDREYLDGVWGRDKRADPKARPVAWGGPAAASTGENADSGSISGLVRALECRDRFKPEVVIGALIKEGVVGTKPAQMGDGIPSYVPRAPVSFHGLRAITIEGWSSQGRMFSRAPGTAPPTHVAITVEGAEADVETKLKKAGLAIGPYVDDKPFLYVTDTSYSEPALAAKYRGRKLSSVICSIH